MAAPSDVADDDALAYVVERRDDGRVLGAITLFLCSAGHQRGEMGFELDRASQGRGTPEVGDRDASAAVSVDPAKAWLLERPAPWRNGV